MRDYSFGNFISALRRRKGLSQYQLGALVGVTDKAVSKWENGTSKPRINTIKKLSVILDTSVDELLTCEYDTFNMERKDLFAMKYKIIKIARNKLKEKYGENPPMSIVNRFKTEEMMLNGRECLLWMGFFGYLMEKCCTVDICFDIRGAQTGASFIAWLLGGTNCNPLPPHYYCTVCKKVEFVKNEKCGLDLPDKVCSCGNNFKKDGFGIDAVNMYPFTRWNEIYISNKGTELANKCLEEYFSGYGLVREINVSYEGKMKMDSDDSIKVTRFGIFSMEIDKKFPKGIITLKAEEYSKLLDEVAVLTVVENTEEQLSCSKLLNMEYTAQQIKEYFDYAVESGKYIGYDGNMHLDKVISDIANPKFNDLLILSGFLHSTGAWEDNAELLYDKGISLSDLIFCREDVYTYLYDKLNGRCCDNPVGQVFEIKEAVRKGKYTNNRMPAEIEKLLLECDVPEWYVESMKKIFYLFPKTHLVMLLKREICNFCGRE